MDPVVKLMYVTLSSTVADQVARSVNHPVSQEALLSALMEQTGLEAEELAQLNLSLEEIAALYSNSTIAALHFGVVGFIELAKDIIPFDVVRARLDQKIKHAGDIWLIHKNDDDPLPSNPHAHNYETGLKLHLGNGRMYHKRDLRGKVNMKTLLAIREKITCVTLPPLEE